jgi:hypothetical protein
MSHLKIISHVDIVVKSAHSFVTSVHLSTHISLWPPLDRLLSNLILGTFMKIYQENPNLVKIGHLKWSTKYPLLLPVTFYPHKGAVLEVKVSSCWDRPAGTNIMQVCYSVMVFISCKSCVVYVCKNTHTHTYSYFPTQHHIHLVSIKAYEYKFPIMQYFDLVPYFIYYRKLHWTNRSSTSGFECI